MLISTTGGLDTYGELCVERFGELCEPGPIIENDDGLLVGGIRNFAILGTLPDGTFYVRVTSVGEATGPYILKVTTMPDSSSRLDAQPIGVGESRNGLLDPTGDIDWWTFTLNRQTEVAVRGSSAVHGELQNARGAAVAGAVSFDLPATGMFLQADLAPGRYYLRLEPSDSSRTGLYTLYLRTAAEPGSDLTNALALTLYEPATGTIDPSADTDYFRIDLGETIYARLWAVGATVNVAGELLDSNGDPVSDAVLYESTFDGSVGFTLEDELAAGTHYLRVTRAPGGSGAETGDYAVMLSENVIYTAFIDSCTGIASTLSDPLYGCQWHLDSTGQLKTGEGEDINVEEAWATTLGSGINVAVVDDGLYHQHRDLRPNVDQSKNHRYTGGADVSDPEYSHGTRVAGIIAARDNSIGVRGVAPRATIYGYGLLAGGQSDVDEADAMVRNKDATAVSNNSWGPIDIPLLNRASTLWRRAVDSGIGEGYGGRGIFYAFAAGNGALIGDYSNLDEYVNYYGVTAVCAVNPAGERSSYSERGANLWVCAPSSDYPHHSAGITTTDNFHRYTGSFSGTSAATPQVSGVAALVRSVGRGIKPDLTWRDVKLILAASARKNHPDDAGWRTGNPQARLRPRRPGALRVQPLLRLRGGGRQGGRGPGRRLGQPAADAGVGPVL